MPNRSLFSLSPYVVAMTLATGCAGHGATPALQSLASSAMQRSSGHAILPPGEESAVYRFVGGAGGGAPYGGVTGDPNTALYGTTSNGGLGYGTVFVVQPLLPWYIERSVYQFQGGSDGSTPYAAVVAGNGGVLYGTTTAGGASDLGTVFRLTPRIVKRPIGPEYDESVLYSFKGGTDGAHPSGQLVIGSDGSLYGTTPLGGKAGYGSVFKLSPKRSGGYSEEVLHAFGGRTARDGASPAASLYLEAQTGSLLGVTSEGGHYGSGTVYKVAKTAGGYRERLLYEFQGDLDGGAPAGTLLRGKDGTFFGVTQVGGLGGCIGGKIHRGCGTVYQLTPSAGAFTKTIIYSFQGGVDGATPENIGTHQGDGIFGITQAGGSVSNCGLAGCGVVFRLLDKPSGWSESTVWLFGNGYDGTNPSGNIVVDASATTYGTLSGGGGNGCGCGMVFLVIPFS